VGHNPLREVGVLPKEDESGASLAGPTMDPFGPGAPGPTGTHLRVKVQSAKTRGRFGLSTLPHADFREIAMKSRYIFFDGCQVVLRDEDLPAPKDNELLIRTSVTTPSVGTELAYMVDHAKPVRLGYSNIGLVAGVGAKVTRYKVGDRLLCKMNHAEAFLWPEDALQCYRVPEGVSDCEAIFTLLAVIAMHLVERAEVSIGRPVVVVGQGTVGQLVGQVARLAGAGRVIAVDLDEKRRALSRKLGAEDAIPPDKQSLAEALAKVPPDTAPPAFIEASGASAAVQWIRDVAPLKSRIAVAGTYAKDISFNPFILVERELDLVGAHQPKSPERTGPYWPYSRRFNYEYVLDCLKTHRLRTADLCDAVLTPDQVPAFYDAAMHMKPRPVQPIFNWGGVP
jgi:threonine dehydrogenase-like Zn-dependent dehydrogenase